MTHDPRFALALAGGLALGAWQAGALTALLRQSRRPGWIAGTSIGAMNAALLAGGPWEEADARLRAFWAAVATRVPAFPLAQDGVLRSLSNWTSAVGTRLIGNPAIFRLRGLIEPALSECPSTYAGDGLMALLARLVDFDALNDGRVRVQVVATDVERAEPVVFDTHAGDRIAVEHLMASGALLPDFPPVRLGGRLLGDGGLMMNLPVDAIVMADPEPDRPLDLLALDLFAPEGPAPTTLAAGDERRTDFVFAAQSHWQVLLHRRLAAAQGRPLTIRHLRQAGLMDDARGLKIFDFSAATLADRWRQGEAAMAEAEGQQRAAA